MEIERESLDIDVLFVGAGPASLSGALHLANLMSAHNQRGEGPPLEVSVVVIEKGKEVGAHSLSGAILDPRALRELVPDFEQKGAPLAALVKKDHVWFLTEKHKLQLPIIPPPLQNHGNYVISLSEFVKWLATQAEAVGVDIFPEFPAVELLFDGDRVIGVQTGDKGVDKHGHPKPNFEPGVQILTNVVVLGEGVRGSLTKKLVSRFGLDQGKNPQVYSVGIKELWEVPSGRLEAGTVIHTLGYPLDSSTFGGGFIYGLSETMLSIGLVIGLSYEDPRLDPHLQFQRFKAHPACSCLLEGGQLVRFGAKALPEGGYYSIPKLYVDGLVLVGDAAGFLNSQRLKGIHLAMKSGMLAAETIFQALLKDDFSSRQLSQFEDLVRRSNAWTELYKVRNFHQSFHHGLWFGLANGALQMISGGRGVKDHMAIRAGHTRMKKISEIRNKFKIRNPNVPNVSPGDIRASDFPEGAGVTFDKLTDVYYSRTAHVEDQPCHLVVSDYDICHNRCTVEYGNPCQFFCPANVYEMVEEETKDQRPKTKDQTSQTGDKARVGEWENGRMGERSSHSPTLPLSHSDSGLRSSLRLQINASNCVHCKTCDIMDPYQIITWVPPEGGGGPDWRKM